MPLVKRQLEPVFISRGRLDKRVKNELEGITVNTLAGVIRQLSSLAKHSENLFSELSSACTAYSHRHTTLSGRVEGLAARIKSLKVSESQQVSTDQLATVKHFQSSRPADHHVLSRESLPVALQELYETSCVPPPALQKMNHLRSDQRDALKFYTDPNHFFEQWSEEMRKQVEQAHRRKKKGHPKKRREGNGPKIVNPVKKKEFHGVDRELRDDNPTRPLPNGMPPKLCPQTSSTSLEKPTEPPPPPPVGLISKPSNPPPAPPPLPGEPVRKPLVPPPPPPPLGAPVPPPPPPPPGPPSSHPPPPPMGVPHKPLNGPPSAPPPPPPGLPQSLNTSVIPPPPPVGPSAPAPPPIPSSPPPPVSESLDPRGGLLAALQNRKILRKVEVVEKQSKNQTVGGDVAAILARRVAIEMDESDSDDDDSVWSDDEEWND